MATHSSILAWRMPWTEEPFELWLTRGGRVGQAGGLGRCSSRPLEHRLSSRGAQAELLPSMWDHLPRPGIKSVSPALADGFFTAEPLGKPLGLYFLKREPTESPTRLGGGVPRASLLHGDRPAYLHGGGGALCEGRFCRLAVLRSWWRLLAFQG